VEKVVAPRRSVQVAETDCGSIAMVRELSADVTLPRFLIQSEF